MEQLEQIAYEVEMMYIQNPSDHNYTVEGIEFSPQSFVIELT